jgi:hypothetical protein
MGVRTFALVAVLLLPVGVAAEMTCVQVEHNIPWYAQAECSDKEPVKGTISGTWKVQPGDQTCYAKMQEAMRQMDFYLVRKPASLWSGKPSYEIGNGPADEIFRVFRNEHKDVELKWINTEPEVEKMILRVITEPVGISDTLQTDLPL